MTAKPLTTSQKHARLKALGKQGRDILYERLRLTDEILRDREYIDRVFGSEQRAIELFEMNEWSDFASRPGLGLLLKAYRMFPRKETWEEYRYDWGAIIELCRTESTEKKPRTSWKKLYQESQVRVRELETEVSILRRMLDRLSAKLPG